jgi:MarR family transcriptional regulator, organic hydroperoxide resistance regulator
MKDPTYELIEMMFQLARLMKEEMSFSNNLMQLSALQIQTLIFLDHNKEVTMSDIAKHFHIELPSATSLLNKLYSKKMVKRSADPKDRRIVKVSLTDAGKSMLSEAVNQRRKKLQKALAYLSKQEKTDLLNILSSLRSRLNKS